MNSMDFKEFDMTLSDIEKRELIGRATHFLSTYTDFLNYEYGLNVTENDYCGCAYNDFAEDIFVQESDEDVPYEVKSGATKVVLVDSSSDWVVKIPITRGDNGVCYEDKNDFSSGKINFSSEYSYGGGDNCDDYCVLEESLSDSLEKDRYFYFFLPTAYLGKVGETPVYYSRKANPSYTQKVSEKSKEKTAQLQSNDKITNLRYKSNMVESIVEAFTEYYGIYTAIKLMRVCTQYEIQDLHSSNYGILPSGRPVIIDYAGYFED